MTALDMIHSYSLIEAASCTPVQSYLSRIWKGEIVQRPEKFLPSPRVTFWTNFVTNIVFLVLFASFLMTDVMHGHHSWMEITVWIWGVSLLMEQFLKPVIYCKSLTHLTVSLRKWLSDQWNKLQVLLLPNSHHR